jgi:hypothetical protein
MKIMTKYLLGIANLHISTIFLYIHIHVYIQNHHYLQYKTFLLSFKLKLQVLAHILIILKSENENTSF